MLAQLDLSGRPLVYFRLLISLCNPLISWKISARNISFSRLNHLPRRTRAPKAKPTPTPLIIFPTTHTPLNQTDTRWLGVTPAYLQYPKALKVHRVQATLRQVRSAHEAPVVVQQVSTHSIRTPPSLRLFSLFGVILRVSPTGRVFCRSHRRRRKRRRKRRRRRRKRLPSLFPRESLRER